MWEFENVRDPNIGPDRRFLNPNIADPQCLGTPCVLGANSSLWPLFHNEMTPSAIALTVVSSLGVRSFFDSGQVEFRMLRFGCQSSVQDSLKLPNSRRLSDKH